MEHKRKTTVERNKRLKTKNGQYRIDHRAGSKGEQESYMVLNRIYNVDDSGNITNATTYINPKDYTYIFATNTETNRDFWVQIGCGVTARRVMSATQIPLM